MSLCRNSFSVKRQLQATISRRFSVVARSELLDVQEGCNHADNSGTSHTYQEHRHQNMRDEWHQEIKHTAILLLLVG